MRRLLWRAVAVCGVIVVGSLGTRAAPELVAPARMMRAAMLSLLNRPPTQTQYLELISIGDETAQYNYVKQQVNLVMLSPEFRSAMIDWGRDYLRYGPHPGRTLTTRDAPVPAPSLEICDASTLYPNHYYYFWDSNVCTTAGKPTATREPWWAPGTTVSVVGRATVEDASIGGENCARANHGSFQHFLLSNCGCGPNLLYCKPPGQTKLDRPNTITRSIYDAPAQQFAHIVQQELPFSDLVVGDYALFNRMFAYYNWRTVRHFGSGSDSNPWWRDFTDDSTWIRKKWSEVNPLWLDNDITHDPTVLASTPEGLTSAGALSQPVLAATFRRERPMAARMMEAFRCQKFSAPPDPTVFPPFDGEPGTSGVCMHCHYSLELDFAARFFKRVASQTGDFMAGVGPFNATSGFMGPALGRANAVYMADSLLTPVTSAGIAANPLAVFYDFVPPSETFLDIPGDSVVGPKGFGNALVNSGEFDTCAVQRIYERFGNRKLDPALDYHVIDALVDHFVANNRSVPELIRYIFFVLPEFSHR